MSATTQVERNLKAVREIWEDFYNKGDPQALLKNVSENFVWKSNTLIPDPGVIVGKAAALERIAQLSKMFPGLFGKIDTIVGSGNTVTVVVTTRAERVNGMMGLPSVDNSVEFQQCSFHIMTEDNKVLEQTFFYDRAYILAQLGYLPRISLFGEPESAQRTWPDFLNLRGVKSDGDGVPSYDLSVGQMLTNILDFPARLIRRF